MNNRSLMRILKKHLRMLQVSKEYEENISTSGEEVENNTFGFLDPDCDENL